MQFIEAGIHHPKPNKFRRLLPRNIVDTTIAVGKKVHSICGLRKSPGNKTSDQKIKPLFPESLSTPFVEGLSLKGDTTQKKTSTSKNKNLGLIPVKSVKLEDIGPSINTIKLVGTSRKIKDIEKAFSIPYQTMYYNDEGKGYQGVQKGTQIEYSSPIICSLYDEKTGKYQAYAKVKTFTKFTGSNGNDFESVPSGYIRTPWFDGVINRQDPLSIKKAPEKKSQTLSFRGYLGPDGKEIPEYILKAVTVNYFGKNIVPKVASTIEKTDQKISMARDIMKNEYLGKKIPLKETSAYKIQIKQLAEKGKMKSLHTSLTEFTINNGNIYDENTLKVMKSIQNSTDWEVIKQKAAFIYRQKRIGK